METWTVQPGSIALPDDGLEIRKGRGNKRWYECDECDECDGEKRPPEATYTITTWYSEEGHRLF